jgi:hypothetical protein
MISLCGRERNPCRETCIFCRIPSLYPMTSWTSAIDLSAGVQWFVSARAERRSWIRWCGFWRRLGRHLAFARTSRK